MADSWLLTHDEQLAGWKGEVDRSQRVEPGGTKTQGPHGPNDRWLEVMSWPDRIFVVHNFLTPGPPAREQTFKMQSDIVGHFTHEIRVPLLSGASPKTN